MRYLPFVFAIGCASAPDRVHCISPTAECFETAAERDSRRAELERGRLATLEAQAAARGAAHQARQAELDAAAKADAERRNAGLAAHRERRQREAAEQAEAEAREARAKTRLEDPAFAVPALSALLCEAESDLAGYRGELADVARQERAAGGDLVDLQARGEIGRDVALAREQSAAYRKGLGNAKRLPCPVVQPIMDCLLRSACDGNVAGLAARDLADVARYAPARFGVGLR